MYYLYGANMKRMCLYLKGKESMEFSKGDPSHNFWKNKNMMIPSKPKGEIEMKKSWLSISLLFCTAIFFMVGCCQENSDCPDDS
jgi:hypothetical protein